MDEREKIVAWLRAGAGELDARASDYIEADAAIFRREAATKRRIANCIERGDHDPDNDQFVAIKREVME